MRLLLDTHALIWWFAGNPRLSESARQAIADASNEVMVSAASAWEIAIKYRARRLPDAEGLAEDILRHMSGAGFEGLPMTVQDGMHAGALPPHHCDPFDRMLIAQALSRSLVLVSIEAHFDRYGVRRLW